MSSRTTFGVMLMAVALCFACKNGGQQKRPDTLDRKIPTTMPAPADPWAAAELWIDAEKEELPDDVAAVIDGWENPHVVRVYRTDDRYEAVVAGTGADRGVPAILLTLTREEASWKISKTSQA